MGDDHHIGVEQCPRHPRYQAKRKPTADCERCREIWRAKAGGKSTNERMNALCQKYGGHIDVDYFCSNTWRVWVHNWHVHTSGGMHGAFSGQGASIKAALDRLEDQARKHPPNEGEYCRQGCPQYSDDIY